MRHDFDDPFSFGFLGIGDDVSIDGDGRISPRGGAIKIGSRVFIGRDCFIQAVSGVSIEIGDDVLVAHNVTIVSSNHVFSDRYLPINQQGEQGQGILIGSNVWIGCNVTILDGVSIGEGSVIAAGAIINRNIPPFSVATGNGVVKKMR